MSIRRKTISTLDKCIKQLYGVADHVCFSEPLPVCVQEQNMCNAVHVLKKLRSDILTGELIWLEED